MANDIVKSKRNKLLSWANRKRVLFIVHFLFNLLAYWMTYVEFTKVFIKIGTLAKQAKAFSDIPIEKGLFTPFLAWLLISIASGVWMYCYLAVSYWKNAKSKEK